MFNTKGIGFITERTRPLAIYTMEEAGQIIAREFRWKLDERRDVGFTDLTEEEVKQGRHVAWLIGFDALVDDRKTIHNLVDKLVS